MDRPKVETMAPESAHEYEHRCCWNCGADNSHIESCRVGEEEAWHDHSAGLCRAFVICHEARSPLHEQFGDYADPPITPNEWHPVAERCPAWISADGIFPTTMIWASAQPNDAGSAEGSDGGSPE